MYNLGEYGVNYFVGFTAKKDGKEVLVLPPKDIGTLVLQRNTYRHGELIDSVDLYSGPCKDQQSPTKDGALQSDVSESLCVTNGTDASVSMGDI